MKYHQRENALIFYQILSTNSLRKYMKISVENLYVNKISFVTLQIHTHLCTLTDTLLMRCQLLWRRFCIITVSWNQLFLNPFFSLWVVCWPVLSVSSPTSAAVLVFIIYLVKSESQVVSTNTKHKKIQENFIWLGSRPAGSTLRVFFPFYRRTRSNLRADDLVSWCFPCIFISRTKKGQCWHALCYLIYKKRLA